MPSSEKRRIRHLYQHEGPDPTWKNNRRGWVTADGRFLETKEHWRSIVLQFRGTEAVSTSAPTDEDLKEGERVSQLAYSLGWISLGHAGELNAVAHERVFQSVLNPAAVTLRQLLSESPESTIQIELQRGSFDPSSGVHEDFDLKEYSLDRLIKYGRLIEARWVR